VQPIANPELIHKSPRFPAATPLRAHAKARTGSLAELIRFAIRAGIVQA
jgi:hypothetical protein